MDGDRAHLAAVLRREYGIEAASMVDAPRGFVADTFDVRATDGRRFFVKLLPLWADTDAALRGLPILEELHALGIDTVSRPLRTGADRLSVVVEERPLIIFDFVDGHSGRALDYDVEQYVGLLARIHRSTALVTVSLPHEDFRLPWAEQFEQLFARVLREPPATAPRAAVRQLMEHHRDQVERDWATLAALARACRHASWTPRLTHGDALGDNLIVDDDGRLYLIDWDAPLLAPAERDTWFFLYHAAPSTARFLGGAREWAAAFLPRYCEAVPDYRPDPLRYRFYLYMRFFADLLGYLVNIVESPSVERQHFNLAELQETCFGWLWPPMRRAEASFEA
jgi:spectinomycin phosphotransferase